jgi:hypothetical protein
MNMNVVDAELTIRALKKHDPANQLFHVADGKSSNKYRNMQERFSTLLTRNFDMQWPRGKR